MKHNKATRRAIKEYDQQCLNELKSLLKQLHTSPLEILVIDSLQPGKIFLPTLSNDYLEFQGRRRGITYTREELQEVMEKIVLSIVAIREVDSE